jgi:protein TonB
MYLNIHLRIICSILALLVYSSAHAAPMLNGLAVHQELGKEIFIGALYSEVLSNDPNTLASSKLPMRMELKIVTPEGIPTRRFSRMWIEGMAINNTNNLLTAQADNMVKFDSLFKGKLIQNDHVVFSVTPNAGVNISVNNVALGNIDNDEFFSMLLSTWIGRVPLSSTYRESLLKVGDVPSDLRTRYDSIAFTSSRVAEISSWGQAAAPNQVAAAPVIAPPQPRQTAPVIERPVTTVELPALETPKSEPAPAAEVQPTPIEPPTPIAPSAITAANVASEDEEDDQPALTAQSLLARQFYVSDMLKKIRANVRYPRSASQRNQEGSMRIAVVISRSGDIANMSWVEESKHARLNREAWEAVLRSAPFPPMPDALPEQRFEFTAPISFEMAK